MILLEKEFFLRFRLLVIFFTSAVIISCVSINKQYGYFPSINDIEKLAVGKSTKNKVESLIGPATVLDSDSWIYVGSRVRSLVFLNPSVIERNVLLLEFNKNEILLSKEIFTISDGKVFDIHKAKAIDDPRRISALKQLFGNISNFSAENFVGDN